MPHDSVMERPYVCPLTHSLLRPDDQALRSSAGDTVYPVRSGIPQFQRFGAAEDDAGRARLARLNALARSEGWEAALRSVWRDDPGMLAYVLQPGRAAFLDLLPLTPHTDVLEIGPGLGQFTALFAQRARSVSALEVVSGQAEFVAQRCAQQGRDNVRVAAGGDDCRLPYPDASFDLVVLNLVFEWCASRCPDEPELEVQRRLLGEMARVLRPGGSLYLATKNRFALKYLIGKADEHSHQMRFGNALPRSLWRWLLRRRGQARPGGLLHSHDALQALIEQAGFTDLRSFWAAPEMRFARDYVSTDAAAVRAARRQPGFVQGEGRSARWLMQCVPAPLVKHLTPGLAFLAKKLA
ncbi:MAG TPA: class I SAM-dependent methyltransferase [Albitalea sp.]|uniref:class I SAM-dependent methyltransferase n=1 Tax=Piscinibacter sp. TaxID=1903157 RepID=UPI002ED055EC